MPNVVIWWHLTTPHINLKRSQGLSNPRNQVLDDALIELMEDVGGDGLIDVDIRQILPEQLNDWLDTRL